MLCASQIIFGKIYPLEAAFPFDVLGGGDAIMLQILTSRTRKAFCFTSYLLIRQVDKSETKDPSYIEELCVTLHHLHLDRISF